MNFVPRWTTACPDWAERIVARESLVPFAPLFPEEAEAALAIFRDLRIVDALGRPTMEEACLPWAFDLPRALFGAYDPVSGRRLIRYFFEFVAKKNAKSTRAAGIMVTALMRNFRDSGEFYILAPTKEIADNSFNPARDMIRADPVLRDLLDIKGNERKIIHRNNGAFLKVVAADSETVGGKKTIGLLVDELWLFGPRVNAESMIREAAGGLTSRPEGFVIFLSTQSPKKPQGIFAQKLDEFRAIRDGKIQDPESLAIFYEYPEVMIKSGDYKKPENFYIPNPNIDRSVDAHYIIAELRKAERAGKASVIDVEAKHLNVQVGMAQRSDGWAGALVWPRGIDRTLTLDELLARSEVVTIGIDGGGLDDLLGVGVIGRERDTNRWLGWSHGLISTIGAYRRKANAEDYLTFKKADELTVFRFGHAEEFVIDDDPALTELLTDVPSANPDPMALPPDIQFVVNLVRRVLDLGLLATGDSGAGVGVDAAGIGAIVDALAKIGVTQDDKNLDAVRQGIALMGAIKTIERKLADGSFRHGAQVLLEWCVGNLIIVPTPTAMRVGRDEAGFGKVDPLMALFNAAHLMALNPEAHAGNVFDAIARNAAKASPVVDASSVTSEIEASILGDPLHPRFDEVRERYNARLAAADEFEDAF